MYQSIELSPEEWKNFLNEHENDPISKKLRFNLSQTYQRVKSYQSYTEGSQYFRNPLILMYQAAKADDERYFYYFLPFAFLFLDRIRESPSLKENLAILAGIRQEKYFWQVDELVRKKANLEAAWHQYLIETWQQERWNFPDGIFNLPGNTIMRAIYARLNLPFQENPIWQLREKILYEEKITNLSDQLRPYFVFLAYPYPYWKHEVYLHLPFLSQSLRETIGFSLRATFPLSYQLTLEKGMKLDLHPSYPILGKKVKLSCVKKNAFIPITCYQMDDLLKRMGKEKFIEYVNTYYDAYDMVIYHRLQKEVKFTLPSGKKEIFSQLAEMY